MTASTDAARRLALVRYFANEGTDPETAHEAYADDAFLEFPQSGERFFGRRTIQEWRALYPAKVQYRLRRITGEGETWIAEILLSYDGGPWKFGIGLYKFRVDRIARETVYVMEGWDPAEWRSQWATRFDPLASVPAAEWRDDLPFGLEADLAAATDAVA